MNKIPPFINFCIHETNHSCGFESNGIHFGQLILWEMTAIMTLSATNQNLNNFFCIYLHIFLFHKFDRYPKMKTIK